MRMTIFLDIEDARFLSEMIPGSSPAREAIDRAMRIREYRGIDGRDVVIECDDMDGLDLLGYAESYCRNAAANIRLAFRLANLRQVGGQSRTIADNI
jgi:hypothetical protein